MAKYKSGTSAGVQFAFEDPDAWDEDASVHTASAETFNAFGQGVDANISPSNNQQRIVGVGSRNATTTVPMQYNGSLTVNGKVTNGYWLLGVLGEVTDSGTAPYDHTYTESDSIPSMTVEVPVNLDSDYTREVVGTVINRCTLTATVNEPVSFSLECNYRHEEVTQSTTSIQSDSFEPFTFAGGTIELPSGTPIASVQTAELTIVNNASMVYGVGSRFAQGYAPMNRQYNIRLTVRIEDFDLLKHFFGNSSSTPQEGTDQSIADMKLDYTNNTTNEQITVTLSNVFLNEDTLTLNPTEVIQEEVTGWANTCSSIVYTNDEATAPAEGTSVT